jgi:hypothetical protein
MGAPAAPVAAAGPVEGFAAAVADDMGVLPAPAAEAVVVVVVVVVVAIVAVPVAVIPLAPSELPLSPPHAATASSVKPATADAQRASVEPFRNGKLSIDFDICTLSLTEDCPHVAWLRCKWMRQAATGSRSRRAQRFSCAHRAWTGSTQAHTVAMCTARREKHDPEEQASPTRRSSTPKRHRWAAPAAHPKLRRGRYLLYFLQDSDKQRLHNLARAHSAAHGLQRRCASARVLSLESQEPGLMGTFLT